MLQSFKDIELDLSKMGFPRPIICLSPDLKRYIKIVNVCRCEPKTITINIDYFTSLIQHYGCYKYTFCSLDPITVRDVLKTGHYADLDYGTYCVKIFVSRNIPNDHYILNENEF